MTRAAATPGSASSLPVWLFVAYGGGHVKALLPVALQAQSQGLARVVFLALTTAAAPARQAGDPRDALDAARAPREVRPARAPAAPRDPFFDQPYEAPATEAAPSWEASAKPATSRVSANIKTKRKVAALFKTGD